MILLSLITHRQHAQCSMDLVHQWIATSGYYSTTITHSCQSLGSNLSLTDCLVLWDQSNLQLEIDFKSGHCSSWQYSHSGWRHSGSHRSPCGRVWGVIVTLVSGWERFTLVVQGSVLFRISGRRGATATAVAIHSRPNIPIHIFSTSVNTCTR